MHPSVCSYNIAILVKCLNGFVLFFLLVTVVYIDYRTNTTRQVLKHGI